MILPSSSATNMKRIFAGLGLCMIVWVTCMQLILTDSAKIDRGEIRDIDTKLQINRTPEPTTTPRPRTLPTTGFQRTTGPIRQREPTTVIERGHEAIKVPTLAQEPTSERVLVIYAYAEIDDWRHSIRKSNLQFFVDFAIGGKHHNKSDVDYVIVVNGYTCTVDIPEQDNTFVIARRNYGYDACAWKAALDYMRKRKGPAWYKYFVFLNSSVKGPFIPAYANDKHWTTYFTKYLNNHVKLVGTSICCSKVYPVHIQTMFLVTSFSGLTLIEDMLKCHEHKQTVIVNIEIGVSQFLLKNGFNIASVMKQWEDHDFRDKERTEEMCRTHNKDMDGDQYYQNAYYDGIDISPFEVIFFKNNRGVNQKVHDVYSSMIREWGEKYAPKKPTGYIGKYSKNYILL